MKTAADLVVGDVVVVHAMGKRREARVVRLDWERQEVRVSFWFAGNRPMRRTLPLADVQVSGF